eukprot:5424070-Alexandrium_andersonii.AAC.1
MDRPASASGPCASTWQLRVRRGSSARWSITLPRPRTLPSPRSGKPTRSRAIATLASPQTSAWAPSSGRPAAFTSGWRPGRSPRSSTSRSPRSS